MQPQKKGAAVDASARITLEVVEVNGEVNGVDPKKKAADFVADFTVMKHTCAGFCLNGPSIWRPFCFLTMKHTGRVLFVRQK